jgi:uncharacterized protein DUF3147
VLYWEKPQGPGRGTRSLETKGNNNTPRRATHFKKNLALCCRLWPLEYVAEIGMQIKVEPSVLRQTKWHEYAVRFFVGGLITAIAGVIAKEFGPAVGGLFLAFPAIFPASATLIEKHEKKRKQQLGLQGIDRGREAASADAAGSTWDASDYLFLRYSFGVTIESRRVDRVDFCHPRLVTCFGGIWQIRKGR